MIAFVLSNEIGKFKMQI